MLRTIKTIAVAAALVATSAASAHAVCNSRPALGAKSFNHGDDWGNDNFGAGFSASAGTHTKASMQVRVDEICAMFAHLPPPIRALVSPACDTAQSGVSALPSDYVKAYADAGFDANVFGGSIEVVGGYGYAESGNGDHDNNLSMQVLGATLFDEKVSIARTIPIAEQAFIDAEKTYWLGPVPVTVGGTVTGTAEVEVEATPGATGASLNVTPSIALTGTAVAAIGGGCAKAGIQGELNLSTVAVPVELSMTFGNEVQADLDVAIEYTVADGNISLFAEVCIASDSWELISWDGYSDTHGLVDQTICI